MNTSAKSNDTITAETIASLASDLGLPRSAKLQHPYDLYGLRVLEQPAPPQKIMLSERISVSDRFRHEFDAWLLARFGRKESMLDPDSFLFSAGMGFIVAPHGRASLLFNATA